MQCPICGSTPVENFSARYVTAAKCGKCGHIYAEDPCVNQGVLPLLDPDAMLREYAQRNFRLIKIWQRNHFLRNHSNLLDVGAGSGHVLRSIREVMPNVQINCVEMDINASRFLRSQGFIILDSFSNALPASYDAILFIEVLEHVNNPIEFLKKSRSLLRAGGSIFLTTPCGETRSGDRKLVTYDEPTHIHFWTEKSFLECCLRAGFEFHPINPGIMYPRSSLVEGIAKDIARIIRDKIKGTRHIVGFLKVS